MTPAPLHDDIADGPPQGRAFRMTTADGVGIRMVIWPAGPLGHVLLLPGRTEYPEKYGRVARDLAAAGFGTVTLDWRGQGLSDRLIPDLMAGHVPSFSGYQKDLQAVLQALDKLGEPAPRVMLAHSMGGCIGLRALARGLPVRAAAFSAPMWGIQMTPRSRPVAWALSTASRIGRFSQRYVPGAGPVTPDADFDTNFLTTDRETFDWMQHQLAQVPELALGGPTLGWLNAALVEMARLARIRSPDLPCYVGLGSREKIVAPAAIQRRMARWPKGRLEVFPGAEHEIMMERPALRQRFLEDVIAMFRAELRSGSG